MKTEKWRRAGATLLLGAACACLPACDDEDPGAVRARQLSLTATPSIVYLEVDPTGTSTLEATLIDENSDPLVGETIEFEEDEDLSGALSAASATTDSDGQASVTFSSTSAVDNTIIASWGDFVAAAAPISIRDVTTGEQLSITSSDTPLASCTDMFIISGTLLDMDDEPIAGAPVDLSFTSTIDGGSATLGGTFIANPATTSSAGTFAVTFTPVEVECTSMCTGTPSPACQWVVSATSLGATAPTPVPIDEGF